LQERSQLPLDDLTGLLQLAMNCSNHVTAQRAANQLPAVMQPAFARNLVVTAAARQHTTAWQRLSANQDVMQHLDTSSMAQLLAAACTAGLDEYVQRFVALPIAQELSSSDVCEQLKAAVQHCSVESLQLLLQLPAAQDIHSNNLHLLLLAAVQHVRQDAPARVQALCGLPASQQLSSSQVCEALQAAAVHGGRRYLEPLMRLSAAQAIGSTDLQPLLLAAVRAGCT
jgi:hypothetical protein